MTCSWRSTFRLFDICAQVSFSFTVVSVATSSSGIEIKASFSFWMRSTLALLFINIWSLSELENVKSFTRTNINKPDFTPRKARKSRHFWHFKPTKQNLWGFLWWINVDKLSIYGSLSIDLNFFAHIFQKWLVFANYFGLPNFLPQLPNYFYTDISVISVTFCTPQNVHNVLDFCCELGVSFRKLNTQWSGKNRITQNYNF